MSASGAVEIYQKHIKPLAAEQRLELLALIANNLASERAPLIDRPKHSLLELHGLGKTIWNGIEAQQYVNGLRDEWPDRAP